MSPGYGDESTQELSTIEVGLAATILSAVFSGAIRNIRCYLLHACVSLQGPGHCGSERCDEDCSFLVLLSQHLY